MSADDIQVITIIVPNPDVDKARSAQIVNPQYSYFLRVRSSFTTLSTNNPNGYSTIEGLLYVPTLDASANSSCADAQTIVPSNVTTLADFPSNQDYPLTAIFPWTDSNACTQAYLSQARADAARGALTFVPTAMGDPPREDDPTWQLDGSTAWKAENQYPIYAVTATIGTQILDNMAAYSGNMSEAPNADVLVSQYNDANFPRLFAHVDLQGGTSVPSLWIFLIIVLAVLLGIVIIASITMHIIQRHQRRTLQRRLERGEVDLESLGIKKMNVPQIKIDEMPKYTFTDDNAPTVPDTAAGAAASKRTSTAIGQPHTTSFSQTTCPICLDDFAHAETTVRELPCKHIFHPECIDLFLRDTSSLCPMCKKSALPPGYCPVKVTNLMVRRERLVRRMRERRRQNVAAEAARAAGEPEPVIAPPLTTSGRVAQFVRTRMGRPSTLAPASGATTDVEMADTQRPTQTTSTTSATPAITTTADPSLNRITSTDPTDPATRLDTRRQTMAVPPNVAAQGSEARRAWRRERLARQQEEQYNAQAERARQVDVGRPLWRRVVGRVIPSAE